MRALTGKLLTVTGFLACPCHLPLTLPLLLGLLGGTSLGVFLRQNTSLIFVGAGVYFLVAVLVGVTLWSRPGNPRGQREGCCQLPGAPDSPDDQSAAWQNRASSPLGR